MTGTLRATVIAAAMFGTSLTAHAQSSTDPLTTLTADDTLVFKVAAVTRTDNSWSWLRTPPRTESAMMGLDDSEIGVKDHNFPVGCSVRFPNSPLAIRIPLGSRARPLVLQAVPLEGDNVPPGYERLAPLGRIFKLFTDRNFDSGSVVRMTIQFLEPEKLGQAELLCLSIKQTVAGSGLGTNFHWPYGLVPSFDAIAPEVDVVFAQ